MPFNDCLDDSDLKSYNTELGEFSYAGPITRLLCVYHNNYPPTNIFYDTKTSVTNDEANELENSETTFGTKLFTSEVADPNDYYSIDDPMDASFTFGGETTTRYFPLPKAGFSGLCDYNKPALYLGAEESECVGILVMDADTCTGIGFNPEFYYSPILNLITDPQSTTTTVTVDTGAETHYLIAADGSYSATTTLVSTFTAGAPAECANHVKEVYFTFTYQARDDGFLIPQAVSAQFILQTTSSSEASVNIAQKFVSIFELLDPAGEIYYQSGNPGYLWMSDLLVGTVDATTSGITLSKDGYMIQPNSGACLLATDVADTIQSSLDNTIKFGENFTTSCYLSPTDNTAAEFETFCNSANTDLTTYYIFDQLTQATRLGKFGNANINYESDWITVSELDLNYATMTYDTTAQTCKLISEVHLQILYSKVGFPDNQHSYIITARKKGRETTTYYDPFKTSQLFNFKVSFDFVEITEDEGSTDAYESSESFEWPSDIFYPFGILDGAYGNKMVRVSML